MGIRRAHLGRFRNRVAALTTRQIHGFVWPLEGIYRGEKQGLGKVLLSFRDEFPDFTFEVLVARKKPVEERPQMVRAVREGWYAAQAHMKANKDYTVAHFHRKMETPPDIGARVWDFDARTFVDDGVFHEKALRAMARSVVDTGVIPAIPPLETGVDKRFLPVRWKQ